jgi:K+-transporting ATPase ATPase C chain
VTLSVLVCCVVYPAAMLAFGRAIVPWKADGSMIADNQGRIVGSAQIAQNFTRPEYFWPRPSAVDYNAGATGGSNLSPANPAVAERAQEIIQRYGLENGQRIPADLVTASGSGVDPHISLDAARFQLPRVAAARGLAEETVERLILQCTDGPTSRVFGGDPVINVLKLNLALDTQTTSGGQ